MITPFERFQEFVGEDGKLTERAATFLEELVNIQEWQEIGVGNAPAFENSWINFVTSGEQATAAFYKDSFGRVYIKGLVKSGTINTDIFTLPTGYIPSERIHLGTMSNSAYGTLRIDTDGAVRAQTGNNTSFAINCSFKV